MVNLSVIKHYALDQGQRRGSAALKYVVLPLIGVALCLWLWTSLSGVTFAVGLSWAALGFIWLVVVTRAFTRKVPTMDMREV